MYRFPLLLTLFALAMSVLPVSLHQADRQRTVAASLHAESKESSLPQRIAWVWERPEDLRELRPKTEGVAILEGTLRLDDTAVFTPRLSPFVVPRDVVRVAVVRIQSGRRFGFHHNDSAIVHNAAQQLIHTANEPGIAALQIDFDARRWERAFYRRLLEEIRGSMPAGLPLDITALVSWCAEDDWIADLPVNSATPMFFRMEPGRARLSRVTRLSAALPEPLCNRSVGVSTHEPWPAGIAGRRVYVFADRGWKADLPLLAATEQHP